MQFNSTLFLFFVLPLTIIIHFLLQKTKLQNIWLLIVSILFFGWCNPQGLSFLLIYALCNYTIARLIQAEVLNRKLLIIFGIIADVVVLFVYKYLNFATVSLNQFFGTTMEPIQLIQPMGISFLTFTTIAYIIDVYRKKAIPLTNFLDFLLYLSFFPKAAQGPITRIQDFSGSISHRTIDISSVSSGLRRFIIGLSKKCLIADVLGASVDLIFVNLSNGISTPTAWLGILFYTLQIYYDFSGYTDMAIGIGQMLGFSLPENFRSPYRSTSVSDFWRRWHITLGTWFRDYLYIPLGGNRKGILRTFFNLGVVWFATGIWHGAAYNYILWGMYYGILIMIEKAIGKRSFFASLPRGLKWLYAFFAVVVGWVIFRSTSLSDISLYFTTMFGVAANTHITYGFRYFFDIPSILTFIIASILLFPCPVKITYLAKNNSALRFLRDIALLLLFVLSIVFMVNSSYTSFIYFQF